MLILNQKDYLPVNAMPAGKEDNKETMETEKQRIKKHLVDIYWCSNML